LWQKLPAGLRERSLSIRRHYADLLTGNTIGGALTATTKITSDWREKKMNSENKRIDIHDLPRSEEALTDEEEKNVQGGLTKVGIGTLVNAASPNTIGGALSGDGLDTNRKAGDGSV
jgi:hypothetical protein